MRQSCISGVNGGSDHVMSKASTIRFLKPTNRAVVAACIITGIAIPVLSIFGRRWLRWVGEHLNNEELSLVIGGTMAVMAGGGLVWLIRQQTPRVAWHGLWLALMLVLITQMLPNVVEWMHFILFGAFGFLAFGIWYPVVAIPLCLLASGLDELLQWLLPDRVGEWRDVVINVWACLIGILLAFSGGRSSLEKQS